jgi:8-hydroxy-5-deazaflavin:NADPH oxidoreductase
MDIGMLGTGMVGRTLGSALVRAGHVVVMGSRRPDHEAAVEWRRAAGPGAAQGTFAEAARHGEVVFNCTAGATSLDALALAGADALAGKILVDVANPLDFSRGMPPTLTVCNTDSLGEQIQRAYPETRVVKALNTMNCLVMVDPRRVPGSHNLFVCGDDAVAKARVMDLLATTLGWSREAIMDLGDITAARGLEMLLPAWVRLMGALGTADFNFHVVRAAAAAPVAAGSA